MTALVKKITAKDLFGKVEKPEKETFLFRVIGIATGFKTGEGTYGPWVKLTGSFKAIRFDTGEEVRSNAAILPDIANDLIYEQIKSPDIDQVQFAFDIGVKPSDSPTGYDWIAKPLTEISENDPLESAVAKMVLPKMNIKSLPGKEKAPEAVIKEKT